MLKGIAVFEGIVIAEVFKYQSDNWQIENHKSMPMVEKVKFDYAKNQALKDINKLKELNKKQLSKTEIAIFDAHESMINDPDINDCIYRLIDGGHCAEAAVDLAINDWIELFAKTNSSYLIERINDIQDIKNHLIKHIIGDKSNRLNKINKDVIVVSDDLTPSDALTLDNKHIKAFITVNGCMTSHTAIIAKSLKIPSIVAVKNAMEKLNNGELIILDAYSGLIVQNPNHQEIEKYLKLQKDHLLYQKSLERFIEQKACTTDGKKVALCANVSSVKDVKDALEHGADGIGLLRTEFLYLESSDFPTEEQQFTIYKDILMMNKENRVVVRTLDIGGDKNLSYFNMPNENNPFLGQRAIRFCKAQQAVFKTQIRALLKASKFGKLGIMFPMIATLEEFIWTKDLLMQEKNELLKSGIEVSEDIKIGMMIEIPTAAIMTADYARFADFFSIGTNDLVQYMMAADRTLESVSYLYQPLHPAILRLIKMVVDGAHLYGKEVAVCGELASDEKAIKLLVGLGVDELSMNASSVLRVKDIICRNSFIDFKKLADEALLKDSQEKVLDLLSK